MVFRPVFVGVGEGALAEKEYLMGDPTGSNFREKPTRVSVGGSFLRERQGHKDWMFYLGKYEVSGAQYQAVRPAAAGSARAPQTRLTRREMDDFIEAYNLWLRAKAASTLPQQDGNPGFLRLPLEEEWEFAARGGIEVTPERFAARAPYEGKITEYEWSAATAFNKLKDIGLLKPNPLGLFDMLANASEMTCSPYQLEKGRGHVGGFVVRGGTFRNAEEELRASMRTEQASVGTDGQPPRDESIGFRLVIASQVFGNLGSSRVLEAASAQRERQRLEEARSAEEKRKQEEQRRMAQEARNKEAEKSVLINDAKGKMQENNLLKDIECKVSRAFVEERLGKPKFLSEAVQKRIASIGLKLTYCRYETVKYELQILYSPTNNVAAFVVRGVKASYQKFTPDQSSMSWTLGQSSFEEIDKMTGPLARPKWISGDAKFVSYVEKYYFGRSGQYCDYYFCSTAPPGLSSDDDLTKTHIDRAKLVPYAVLVSESSPRENKRWESFLVDLVGLPGRRFEE